MVTPKYLPHLGGIESHVHEVAQRMSAAGHEITVLTIAIDAALPASERQGDVLVKRFPAMPSWTDLYLSPALARQIRQGGYDLVHMQGVHTLLAPMTLATAQRAGIPTVLTFHSGGNSSRLRTAIREMQWQAQRPVLRRSTALVAVCQYEVDQFGRRLGVAPETIRLIRNGAGPLVVDEDSAPNVRGAPLVCSVGRLERYKGHQRVIAAMPALLKRSPGAHLAVVGRGPYERHLREMVSQLGLERAVTLTSFDGAQRGELGALVRASDVVVLLSEYEANPVAVMEALALGRKVVVAATSGLTELAANGYATAVPISVSPDELARVLMSVVAGPDGSAPDLPTWDRCVEELLGLYADVVSAGS